MKKRFFIFIFIFGCMHSYAQTERRLVLNINSHRNSYPTIDNKFKLQKAFPSFEIQNRKGNRILSFELAKLFWNQKCYGPSYPIYQIDYQYQSRNFQSIIRFQYQRLIKTKHAHWQPFYGGAISAHYSRTNRIPFVSTHFPKTVSSLGLDQHLSLGTYYNFGKYFVHANALLGLSSFALNGQNLQNPSLVQSAQKNSTFNFTALPKDYLFRLGIGIKI